MYVHDFFSFAYIKVLAECLIDGGGTPHYEMFIGINVATRIVMLIGDSLSTL